MTREELKESKTWCNWNLKDKDGKITKVPVAFDGTPVGTDTKYYQKWCDYATAKVQVDDETANGVGLILNKITPDNTSIELALAGIDIDHKNIDDVMVQDILGIMDTYAEISPSGNGVHLLFLVDTTKLPENYKDIYYMKNPHKGVECYIAGFTNRFLTFTENVVIDKDINERTDNLIQFLNIYMCRNNSVSEETNVTVSNDNITNPFPKNNQAIIDVIERTKQAEKFINLFHFGDTSDYNGDASSADMALATMLAFYVGPDFERIDNLMKQSALFRVKWDRPDYKEMTIKKAIANCNGNFFNWNNQEVQDRISNYSGTVETLTAKEIQSLNVEPPPAIVINMLHSGFSLVAGSPKVGKSWFSLDLGISVCRGQPFLGFDTNKSEVLYLALEDTIYRLKDRINKILGANETAPDEFHITTSCHAVDEGLLNELQNKLIENPNIKLIIIDTLQKVRANPVKGETWYASDYKEIAKLKKFADINKVCILAVHHLRKQKDTDPFNQISGSTGITGAADTMIVLNKLENGNGEVMMSITGRDVDYTENVLKFNKNKFKWEVASQNTDFESYKSQLAYNKNPIVTTIKALVHEHPEGFTITATELLKAIHDLTGVMPRQNKPQTLSREINENLQFQLWDFDKIYYEAGNKNGGSSGRKMYFSKDEHKKKLEDIQDELEK